MKYRYVCLIALIAIMSACAGSTPATPTPAPVPVVPACQVNNTASVTFENKSNTNSTYTIVWDGSSRVTLVPGQDSNVYTESATVAHSLQFKYTNSNILACSTSFPILSQCSSHTLSCTG